MPEARGSRSAYEQTGVRAGRPLVANQEVAITAVGTGMPENASKGIRRRGGQQRALGLSLDHRFLRPLFAPQIPLLLR